MPYKEHDQSAILLNGAAVQHTATQFKALQDAGTQARRHAGTQAYTERVHVRVKTRHVHLWRTETYLTDSPPTPARSNGTDALSTLCFDACHHLGSFVLHAAFPRDRRDPVL